LIEDSSGSILLLKQMETGEGIKEKLESMAGRLDAVINTLDSPDLKGEIEAVQETANEVGKAASGSWLGYQASVYYANLRSPPPGAVFSVEWGLDNAYGQDTQGDWQHYTPDSVRQEIFHRAGVAGLNEAELVAKQAGETFESIRDEFCFTLELAMQEKADSLLSRLKEEGETLKRFRRSHYLQTLAPKHFFTRDSRALSQGKQAPPHVLVLAEIFEIKELAKACRQLKGTISKALARVCSDREKGKKKVATGGMICIGHGRSAAWKDLKDFIQDKLKLRWDEFNRISPAGVTNVQRLNEMLDRAGFAFLVMTAEDEQADGKLRARMNVVHEVGLFQGRIGFERAIILLEEACEGFSNIEGLGQIRFPKGNIKAAFEDIRDVLLREGVIS
jgi:predicted nucleotide-binding protein